MKIYITEAEMAALSEKTDHTHVLRASFGPGWTAIDTDDPDTAWVLPHLLAMRKADVKDDEKILRRKVLDAVTGCITELYFKGSGYKREIRDSDAHEITEYVMGAIAQARELTAQRPRTTDAEGKPG